MAISTEEAHDLVRPEAARIYSIVFAQVVSNGNVSEREQEQLSRFRSVLGLSKEDASEIVRRQAIDIYRERFYEILQDGTITQEEEQRLNWLQRNLSLSRNDIAHYLEELAEAKRLASFRNGNLPSIRTSRMLESGEICHWIGECTFVWETPTTTKEVAGELIVTNQRIILTSPIKSFEFSPSKIVDIEANSKRLAVATTGPRGAGRYFVSDAGVLEAVVVGIVRKHKFLLAEGFSSNRTRRIPESVKREVWFRDGGRCVTCASDQYLEFDHIIPFAKGGANTVNNVQILCRGCNGMKRDRI